MCASWPLLRRLIVVLIGLLVVDAKQIKQRKLAHTLRENFSMSRLSTFIGGKDRDLAFLLIKGARHH